MPMQPQTIRTRRLRHARGLSLVEVMVSLVLGLVVIGGVLTLYLSTHETFRRNEDVARMQESGRLALELMAREIREAGLTPCGSPVTANVLVAAAGAAQATSWWADTAAGFLRGGESSGQGVKSTGTAVADHVDQTDSLLVLRPSADEGLVARVISHVPSAQTLHVSSSAPATSTTSAPAAGTVAAAAKAYIRAKDLALLCDNGSSALFQVDTVDASTGVVTYAASPSNCSTALGQVDAQCGAPIHKTFPPGALLVPWEPGMWYVGNRTNGRTALYRAQPQASPQEKVRDVQNLQIEYLTRDRSNNGGLATQWVNASVLQSKWADPALEVAAIRLTLTVSNGVAPGASGTPLTRSFRSVIALRNREP